MIKYLVSIALLLFISCNPAKKTEPNNIPDTSILVKSPKAAVVDQPHESVVHKETADPIAGIRHKVEQINATKLEQRHFEFMCDEKMMVDYYYMDGEIVKISVDFGTVGDVYAKEDYYYDAGKLIFMYEFVEGGPACQGCIKTDEYRSYLQNNKVIKYLKNKIEGKCRKCEFGPTTKHYKLLLATTPEQMKSILCGRS